MKKIKNRQTWRCYRPKYSLGGPGRPPQPEFASKITARRVNFSGNSQPKLRFGGFSFFLFFCSFFFPIFCFFWKNGTVSGPNTLSEAPGDLRSRNLHPKSGPVASTFLVIRNQNWDLAFFRFFGFLFLSNSFFFEKMASFILVVVVFFSVLENMVMMIVVRKERQKARRKARQSLYTS